MKRRNVDASPPSSAPAPVDVRSIQQQQQQHLRQLHQYYRDKTNTPNARLYAQLQHPQQLRQLKLQQHEEHQVLLASGKYCCQARSSVAEHQGASLYQGQEMQTQPHTPTVAWTTSSSPSASQNSISSLISPSNSPAVSKFSLLPSMNIRSVVTSPQPLPGISTVLRAPNPPGRQRRQSLSASWPLSVRSPILKQERHSSNDMPPLPYKWEPELTSTSLVRSNSTPTCYGNGGLKNAGTATSAVSTTKTSRYLREMDRREILARIEQGETQADLAKEFQVSRAAICNLNKHREDVMRRRGNNPYSRHPKKSFKTKINGSSSKAARLAMLSFRFWPNGNGSTDSGGMGDNIHEVKSRATAQLITRLRNRNATISENRVATERLVRLVLEEALAFVPVKSVGGSGVDRVHPPCAISMESQEHADCGSPLLDLFRVIEPDQPSARASVAGALGQCCQHKDIDAVTKTQPSIQEVTFVDSHLFPASLQFHNVFVLDVSATSAALICVMVQKLLERGALEAMIYFVGLFIDSEVIASVHKRYPSVKIVAAQIDRAGTVHR